MERERDGGWMVCERERETPDAREMVCERKRETVECG